MTNKNRKRAHLKKKKRKIHAVVYGFAGLCLLVCGIGMSIEISMDHIPRWVDRGLIIQVATEDYRANVDVSCEMREEGNISLSLCTGAGEAEPIRVWIFVLDGYYPFHWRVDGAEHVFLNYVDGSYPIGYQWTAEKTGCVEGESSKTKLMGIYNETFTMLLEPGKDDYAIYFQMQPENLEYQRNGDIMIRVPLVMADRRQPMYDMDMNDFLDLAETKGDSLLPYISIIMVDENPLFTPALYIKGDYFNEKYFVKENYIVKSVQPTPIKIVNNTFSWEEELQWIPRIIFHDLAYDKRIILKNWIGGILIAVGSGLIILPVSDWLNPLQKKSE